MSLNLIYGRSGTGKSRYLYQQVVHRAKSNPNREIWIIVPDQFSFQAEKNLLFMQGPTPLPNVRVFSFSRLATDILGRYGGITRRYLGKTGKNILVHLIIRQTGKKLKFLKKAIRQKGFSQILCDTFAELKRYRIEPNCLSEFAITRENTLAGIKASELSVLFQKYDELLHNRYLDNEDRMVEAALRIEQSGCLLDKEIWIDGFQGFTPIQHTMIETFLRYATEVYICLLTDCISDPESTRETDIFYPVKIQIRKLLDMAAQNDIKVYVRDIGKINRRHAHCPELAHLEKHLFTGNGLPYPEINKSIYVFEGSNPQDEITKIASRMIVLSREHGYRWRDMALILPDIESYRHIIETTFSRFSIHYFMDEKEMLTRHPVAVFLLSMLEVLIGGFQSKDIFRMLKTGMTDNDRDEVDILENYCLSNRVEGKKKWTLPFTRTPIEEGAELEELERLRGKIISPIVRFMDVFREKREWRTVCETFFEVLMQLGVHERLQQRIDLLERSGMLTQAGHYRQIWNVLMEMLDEVVELSGEETVSLRVFYELLSTGLSSIETGMIPASLDAVTIGNTRRSRLEGVKALFIAGAVDGLFPGKVDAGGFLSDDDRRVMLEAGIELAPDTRNNVFERQLEVYRMLAVPSEMLYISYPQADPEGKTLRPAYLVKSIRMMFPNTYREEEENDDHIFFQQITTPAATFEELSVVLRKAKNDGDVHCGWNIVSNWFDSRPEWKQRLLKIMSGFSYTNQPRPLSPEIVKKVYGKDIHTSISRLEQYQNCPFSYFARYCLFAGERKIGQWTEVDYGLFMHRMMERLLFEWDKTGKGWNSIDANWLDQNVPFLLDEVLAFSSEQEDFPARDAYFRDTMRQVVRKTADYVFGHIVAGAFSPTGFELEFGMGGKLPPMVLPLNPHQRLYLSGKIDRIDVCEKENDVYLRVVDYKSGTKKFSLEDLYYGLQIQLAAYASSIKNFLVKDEKRRAVNSGLLYVPLTIPVIRADRETTADDIDERLKREMRMQGIVLQDDRVIKAMDISLSPGMASNVIPVKMKKDGTLDSRSMALSAEKLDQMEKYLMKMIEKTGERILAGDIRIAPCRKRNETACRFCPYISICNFDSSLQDNRYRILKPMKDDLLWEKMSTAENHGMSHKRTEQSEEKGRMEKRWRKENHEMDR